MAESRTASMLARVFVTAAGRPLLPLCVLCTVPLLSKCLTSLSMTLSLYRCLTACLHIKLPEELTKGHDTEPLKGHVKYILLRSLEILLRSLAIILRSLEKLFHSLKIAIAFPRNTFTFS